MIEHIIPYTTEYKKIRLGNNGDGGYVLSEIILEKSQALFSYGVGGDISFDKDFVKKTKRPAYLFDHTVSTPTNLIENIYFYKEGLGIEIKNCKDFLQHYIERNIDGPVLLKIDIEGAEYPYLESCDFDSVAEILTGFVVEIHKINLPENQIKLNKIFEKIKQNFVLIHVHGNNWGKPFLYKDDKIEISNFPRSIECTFVKKDLIKSTALDIGIYPIENLDFPNKKNADFDFKFDFSDISKQLNKNI